MRTLPLIFSLFLFLSCSNDDDVTFQTSEIVFTEIEKSALYGNGAEGIEPSNLLINNETDWQDLMDQMNSYNEVTNTFTETDIDFDAYSIVAIFLEVKGSGWALEITNITENENNNLVSIEETESLIAVMTQPFHIVKIPKTNKGIVLQ